MAIQIPYLLLAPVTLAANGQNTFNYPVPQGQKLYIKQLFFTSTGAFKLVGLSDAAGTNYTNVTPASGIPSTLLASGSNNNNAVIDFEPELIIEGGNQLNITLLDTSNSTNTVSLLLNTAKDIG